MKFFRNITDHLKATVIGLVLLGVSLTYLFLNVKTLHEISFKEGAFPGAVFLLGLLFVFGTDSMVDKLRKLPAYIFRLLKRKANGSESETK